MAVLLIATFWVSPVKAQSNQNTASKASVGAEGQAQAASKVSAEMVKGKLSPATSKPGDQVTVRMKDDVKSNGQIVLKKGSEINGVVRSVKRADAKGGASAQSAAQSMMQVEWLTSAGSGASAQQLNFALQSIAYTNPLYANQQQQESATADSGIAATRPSAASSRAGAGPGGGLVGGVAGGVVGGASSAVGVASGVGGSVAGGARAIGGQTAASAGAFSQTQAGLLPASSQTASSLQDNFGVSSNQLLMAGHGQTVSSGGTASSMDIFTHMSNDAVITSPSKDFEIASGAQMQFMVSAKGQK